jgi:hypothetical protein
MRITTVIKKPMPDPVATILKSLLSSIVRAEYWGNENSISEVIRRIRAIAASHNSISATVNGKFILPHASTILIQTDSAKPSGDVFCFSIVTGLPDALATAHATALTKGQPRILTLFKSFSLL